MKRVPIVLGWVFVLSACAAGKNYSRPDLKVPDQFRFAGTASGGATTLGDEAWWDLYQDPRLQELIRIALNENFDVRIAAARVEEARAALGTSRVALLPQISVGATAQRAETATDEVRGGQPRMADVFGAQANLSYELDIWGRLRRSTQAARADLLASEFGKRAVIVGLVSDVATSYFQLVTFNEELAIAQRTLQTRRKLVELTRAKHDRGVISGLDVAAAEAQLAVARVTIPQQELNIALTEHRLSVFLGRYPQAIEVASPELAGRLAPVPPSGLPSSILERRPDVQQSEAQLVAANARVGAAKALLFPSLTLTGAFGRISTDLSRLFTPENTAWSVSSALLQPLLDPQRSVFQKRAAAARRREALEAYSQIVHRALQEVADALITRTKQAEIQTAQRDQVDALQRASTIAHARYDVGTASYVDVTNADRDLFTAELALALANRDTLLASVQLYRALGGGWQVPAAGAASALPVTPTVPTSSVPIPGSP